MRKNFTILLLTLFSILASFSYANQNPDVVNQQRNIQFMNMMGQIELDKRRQQEYEANQRAIQEEPRDDRIYHRYAVFVWNEDTGHFYGFPELLVAPSNNSKKAAIKLAKKEFKRIGNADGLDIKATDHLIWNGGLRYIVVIGTNKKTGKWEAFTKFEVDDENIKILINKCSETCDDCQFAWSN
ncbi:hypothetical protein LDJ98_04470 [Fusobacterium nucleatum]|uniref:hypothetical protein n=1 Tax=Fusobacterium nucleatum TaxID=851 RepID=UPI0030CE5F46